MKKKKALSCVWSLKYTKAWVRMHGAKCLVHLHLKAMRGIIEAKGIRKLLAKKVKNQAWRVERIEHLDPLIEIHKAMEAARNLFDELLRSIPITTDVPASGRIARAIATTDVPPSGRIARAIPSTSPLSSETPVRGSTSSSSATPPSRSWVQPLGTQIETLGRALVEVVRTPLVEAQNPLPNLRYDLLVAKKNLHCIWGTWVRINREG